ncbi:MAG: TIGR03619 family F420-dependent LLM class oxidoreductase, partial [Stellaceae bacterium]
VWAPEHYKIPLSRKTPFAAGGELPKQYYDVMDPFVTLAAAAAVTKTIKLGTGVCLVIQRDTIQTAKAAASLDQVSGGRFLFGIGGGWNQDEMEDHGTVYASRFKKMREQIEGMREIWTKSKPEYHGDIVSFPPMMTWPKPAQTPLPVIVGGAFPHAARRAVRYGNGWAPIAGRAPYGDIGEQLPKFHAMLAEAGRKKEDVPVTLMGGGDDVDLLKRYRDMGIVRWVAMLPSESADKTLPRLDHWAEIMRRVNS